MGDMQYDILNLCRVFSFECEVTADVFRYFISHCVAVTAQIPQ